MKSVVVILHDAHCKLCEAALLWRAEQDLLRLRHDIEARASVLQARLAADRRRLARTVSVETAQTGMARRLSNLTYPIEQARQMALARFEAHKRRAMDQLIQLLADQQREYSLRELAAELGVSHMTVGRYRRELVAAGLVAA
jgi:hypothetical protein